MAKLETVTLGLKIQPMGLLPGDKVVIKLAKEPTLEEKLDLESNLKLIFGSENPVIVLGPETEIGFVRRKPE